MDNTARQGIEALETLDVPWMIFKPGNDKWDYVYMCAIGDGNYTSDDPEGLYYHGTIGKGETIEQAIMAALQEYQKR